jgi:excisionase family DNA binding protein
MNTVSTPCDEPIASWLTVADFCARSTLGRTTVHALLLAGKLPSVKIGQRRLISAAALEPAFLASLSDGGSRSALEPTMPAGLAVDVLDRLASGAIDLPQALAEVRAASTAGV